MSPGRTQGTEDTQTVKTLWLIVKTKTKPWHLARKNHVLLINFSSDKKFLLSSAMSPFSCCHQIQIFSLINLSSRSIWKEQVGEMMISSPTDLGGRGFSTVLDPWTGSAVLNILSTVCLPSADLPDMLSSRLAGDATSLRISPATREAPLHFLWINLHTVGEEERPGHRGTGAEMKSKRTHSHTHSFPEEQHTTLATVWTPSVKARWILWNHPVTCDDLKPIFFNYSIAVVYEILGPWVSLRNESWLNETNVSVFKIDLHCSVANCQDKLNYDIINTMVMMS